MVAAVGLSQYNVALMHVVNHAFFVRQHRYWNLDSDIFNVLESHLIEKWNDDPSFRNFLKKDISTNISFKFKLNLRWERLMKMNFRKNCINMIENFYSFEKFIMEKINEGFQVMSRCRIEKISSPYFSAARLLIQIFLILKVGNLCQGIIIYFNYIMLIICKVAKTNISFIYKFHKIVATFMRLICNYFFCSNLIYLLLINYLKFNSVNCAYYNSNNPINNYNPIYKKKSNTLNRTAVTSPASQQATANFKIFKLECKELFKPYKSLIKILFELKFKIPKWLSLLDNTYKNISYIRHFIHKRCFLWMIKKHKKVSKNKLYDLYFKEGSFNFSLLKTNKDIKNFHKNFHKNLSRKYSNSRDQKLFFDLAKPNLKFLNVEKEYNNILNALINNKSGIYLFWLLNKPYKCYLGSSVNLRKRFYDHYRNAPKSEIHVKFYNSVKKHSWSIAILRLVFRLLN